MFSQFDVRVAPDDVFAIVDDFARSCAPSWRIEQPQLSLSDLTADLACIPHVVHEFDTWVVRLRVRLVVLDIGGSASEDVASPSSGPEKAKPLTCNALVTLGYVDYRPCGGREAHVTVRVDPAFRTDGSADPAYNVLLPEGWLQKALEPQLFKRDRELVHYLANDVPISGKVRDLFRGIDQTLRQSLDQSGSQVANITPPTGATEAPPRPEDAPEFMAAARVGDSSPWVDIPNLRHREWAMRWYRGETETEIASKYSTLRPDKTTVRRRIYALRQVHGERYIPYHKGPSRTT